VKRKLLISVVVAMALLIGAVLIYYLTSDHSASGSGSDSHAHLDPLNPHDANADMVARNTFTVAMAWQPSRDSSTWDALHRAAPMLTGSMSRAAATPPQPSPKPLTEWATWARDGDSVTAAVSTDQPATVDGDSATVTVRVSQIVLHPNGETTPWRHSTLAVRLARVDGVWLVDSYTEVGEPR
jgi:hypothetical protein